MRGSKDKKFVVLSMSIRAITIRVRRTHVNQLHGLDLKSEIGH